MIWFSEGLKIARHGLIDLPFTVRKKDIKDLIKKLGNDHKDAEMIVLHREHEN